MNYKKITFGVYPGECKVFWDCTNIEAAEKLGKTGIYGVHREILEEDLDDAGGCTIESGTYFVIWVSKPLGTREGERFMAHELMHLVIRMMRLVGIPLDEVSEEAYTYLMGHVREQLVLKG